MGCLADDRHAVVSGDGDYGVAPSAPPVTPGGMVDLRLARALGNQNGSPEAASALPVRPLL